MYFNIVFILFGGAVCLADNLPEYIKPCTLSSPDLNECAVKNGNAALPVILKGDKKFKITSMLPIKIPLVNIDAGNNLKIKLTNVVSDSAPNIKIQTAKIDDNAKTLAFDCDINRLEVIADYEINGQILILPISGSGPTNITYVDGIYSYTSKYKEIEKDGKTYIDIYDSDLKFTSKRGYFYFGNLFNGDKRLGDEMNKFIDENWQEFSKEISPGLAQTMLALVDNILKRITAVVPKNEIFLP